MYGQLEEYTAKLVKAAPSGVTVNRVGSMFTFFFAGGPVTDWDSAKKANTKRFGEFFRHMLERGVYLPPSQFEAGFVSAAHSEDDLKRTGRCDQGVFEFDASGAAARPGAPREIVMRGEAQQIFARPAVRAMRRHLVRRIRSLTHERARVLSLGCGIGDTELLLAREVQEVVGVDLSPAAVRQAKADAAAAGVSNARFLEGTLDQVEGQFDLVMAVFFLHHLPDGMLEAAPIEIGKRLAPGGVFYSLDPSRQRLSGAVGSLVVPRLMRKYQTPDERELDVTGDGADF